MSANRRFVSFFLAALGAVMLVAVYPVLMDLLSEAENREQKWTVEYKRFIETGDYDNYIHAHDPELTMMMLERDRMRDAFSQFDFDGNGIPELLIKTDIGIDQVDVFSYRNGRIDWLGAIGGENFINFFVYFDNKELENPLYVFSGGPAMAIDKYTLCPAGLLKVSFASVDVDDEGQEVGVTIYNEEQSNLGPAMWDVVCHRSVEAKFLMWEDIYKETIKAEVKPVDASDEGCLIYNDIQLYNVLMQCAKNREESMKILCGDSYSLDQLKNDLYEIQYMLGITNCSFEKDESGKNSAILNFKYKDSFRICESSADICDYIEECSETNEQEINIYIARDYSYQCLADNHYELDYALANSRLMYPGNYYYNEEYNLITYPTYPSVEYIQNGAAEDRFAFSWSDLLRIVEKKSSNLSDKHSIFVSDDVLTLLQLDSRSGSTTLRGKPCSLLSDVESNNGLYDSFGGLSIKYHWVNLEGGYYPGKEIAYAYKTNKVEELSEIYQKTLSVALQIVEGVTGDDLQRVRQIHDRLCRRIRYSEENTGRSGQSLSLPDTHNAIGALVYGHSVCEGFADAFYLCCSLANIEVKYVTGSVKGGNHLWNLVRLGSKWYMVDATWDSHEGKVSHDYFLIGTRKAHQDHSWDDRAIIVSIVENN